MPTRRRQLSHLRHAPLGVMVTLALVVSAGCMGAPSASTTDATDDARFAVSFEVPPTPNQPSSVTDTSAPTPGDDVTSATSPGDTIAETEVGPSPSDAPHTDATHTEVQDIDDVTVVGPDSCETLTAIIHAEYDLDTVPMTVTFHAHQSCTPIALASTLWSFGVDDAVASGAEATYTYLESGSFVVTLTLTDIEGGAHAVTMPVTVAPGVCPTPMASLTTGTLALNQPAGPSGISASHVHDDTFWFVSDSGSEASLYATNAAGQDLGSFPLAGAQNVDWEDIAIGYPSGDGPGVLYIWDGGDNNGTRDSVQVLMVPEPTQESLDQSPSPSLAWTSLSLKYPDGAALNSDTLMVDPQTGDLVIVATDQASLVSHVFLKPAPHTPGSETSLTWIAEVDFSAPPFESPSIPSGGAFSPLGDRLMVRTDDHAFLWLRDGGSPLESALGATPCAGPFAVESGGEAITFSADGHGYLTVSDEVQGVISMHPFEQLESCDPPEARISVSPEGTLQAPVTVTFEADPACIPEGIDWVKWNLGGTPSAESSPSHTFLEAAQMEVTLTVADLQGVISATTQTIEVLPAGCPSPGPAEDWGTVSNNDVNEASGLVMSTQHDDLLWTHNDSGDSARLFAIGLDGADRGTWSLDTNIKDWEDLAYGFDATLNTEVLYVGDVGDNAKSRDKVTIYIVPEPDVDTGSEGEMHAVNTWSSMTLTYPDGASHNCETLMRDPQSGDLYLVIKSSDGVSPIFRKPAPHTHGSETELEWVGELLFGTAPLTGSKSTTAGAFSPTGDRVLIRTYTDAWVWQRGPNETVAEALAGEPCNVEATGEPQGEAACFHRDDSGYLTLSEGMHETLHYIPLN
ncbi:MAG: PKD domain-containing protein [Myxococcota bacterium]